MDCVWFVSGFRRPWEAAVIGNLAAALGTKNFLPGPPLVYVDGGTAYLHADGVLSWNSLTFFERAKIVLFKGKVWHLWGNAPSWWGWVRLRARTVHTSLDAHPKWKGHPTRLFAEQARDGESLIVPTFEVKAAWAEGHEEDSPDFSLLLAVSPDEALKGVLAESKITPIFLSVSETEASLKRAKALLVDDSPSNVLLAAYLTMRGVPVVASRDAPLPRAVLGPGGYIVPKAASRNPAPGDALSENGMNPMNWKEALEEALSDAGRSASASARRFLKANYSLTGAVESLERLYRTVAEGKS
jgi:hypothetical protein